MCPSNTNTGSDDNLSAGLIIATTTTTTPSDTKLAGKRCWRLARHIVIGVVFSLKRVPIEAEEASASYVPLPTTPPASAPAPTPTSGERHVVIEVPPSESQKLLETLSAMVTNRDLSRLRELGGVPGVMDLLLRQSCFQEGSDPQARMSGSNTTWESKGFFYFLIQASNSYTILLLFVSAALAFGADITDQGLKYGWHDGVAILIAIFVLVVFPSVSNFYRERNMLKKLLKDKRKLEVNVLRNGNAQCLPISDVKTGDRVFLKKGDYIPADGLFVDGENFILDEILNSKIDDVRNPFLFAGSKVMDGHGRMLVISIGANTAWGGEVLKLFSTHGSNEKKLFPSLMDKSYTYMDTLSLCISVLVALVVLIRILVSRKESNRDLPELKGEVSMKFVMEVFERVLLKPQGKVSILASMLVTIVIGIQHGMLIVITFSLCCWNKKLEANQVNPQNISACVSMGQVTRIFLDASGICKEVEVKEFWAGEKDIISNELGNENDGEVLATLHRRIGLPLPPEVSVSPRNAPLISWMEGRWNLNMEILDKNFISSNEKLNSSSRVDGALTWKTRDEGYIHCKGAASMVLEKSTHFYDTEGKKHAIGSQKGSFEKVIENMENHGLRPLAFACRKTEDIKEFKEDGLNLLAILGLQYQLIHGIKSVVEALTKAGVMAKLVSDDELSAV
ncbi:hypothetical protein FEM48_Zijuj04G0134100 [Ziziphus jujuba var. spinosa]|uniref:P-type ATPase A domain-containing protein n=1 Tax=Ziziphus jujuba var. spinosa TaxID=714518 RepID=A0A978VK52_ZIZJJ|nr:hypothetical protein FEM48_Zijuj04G0134100 [Ziziphus jujuba var. spinosa]